jgi:hypothetical protein
VKEIPISIRSTIPDFVSHSAQSSAWTLAYDRHTCTPRSGHCFLSAYIRIVILAQDPSAAKSNSYGLGPASLPPKLLGSSAWSTWGPIDMVWAYLKGPASTNTSLGTGFLLAFRFVQPLQAVFTNRTTHRREPTLAVSFRYDSIRADESSVLTELRCVGTPGDRRCKPLLWCWRGGLAEQTQRNHDGTGRQQGPHPETRSRHSGQPGAEQKS